MTQKSMLQETIEVRANDICLSYAFNILTTEDSRYSQNDI